MMKRMYVVIDKKATGENIERLMKDSGISVRELRDYMGFACMQSIYHWLRGKNIPTVDNLLMLSILWDIPVNEIICFHLVERNG